MKKMLRRLFSVTVSLLLVFALSVSTYAATYSEKQLEETREGIVDWCRAAYQVDADESLFNELYRSGAGTSGCDWYPIAMSQSGYEEDYGLYLEALLEQVKARYETEQKLDHAKATEWHRIALAVLACGGDPVQFAYDSNGELINLIADGVYNRGLTEELGKQGINGWIWGLIALDSLQYEVPENAYNSRDDIIVEILKQQLDDGGYDLQRKAADPDMTSMAIYALAPYYSSEKEYTYTRRDKAEPQTNTVRYAVDLAIETLSAIQQPNGGFLSWEIENVESAAQVIIALSSLGIDVQSDERFIKDGNTILDFVMSFRMEDGGFAHAKNYDPENPGSRPDESNSMAGEQVLLALTSALRQMRGQGRLYDFRPEGSSQIPPNEPDAVLTNVPGTPEEIARAVEELILPPAERSRIDEVLRMSEDSTEKYVDVVLALSQVNALPPFSNQDELLCALTERQEKILQMVDDIAALNEEIASNRSVLEAVSLSDKELVDELYERYMALAEYDRTLIEDEMLLLNAKEAADKAVNNTIILGVAAVVVLVSILAFSWKKRKNAVQ